MIEGGHARRAPGYCRHAKTAAAAADIHEMFQAVAGDVARDGFDGALGAPLDNFRKEIGKRIETLHGERNISPPALFFALWDAMCWLLASAPPDVRAAALDLFGQGATLENILRHLG